MADSTTERVTMAEVVWENNASQLTDALKRLFLKRLNEDAECCASEQTRRNEEILVTCRHVESGLRDTARFMSDTPFGTLLEEIRRLDEEAEASG